MRRIRLEEREYSNDGSHQSWIIDIIENNVVRVSEAVVSDPFTSEKEADLKWYLEKWSTESPFEVDRAREVERSLTFYGVTLSEALELETVLTDGFSESHGKSVEGEHQVVIQLEIVGVINHGKEGSQSIHALHWELLEFPGLCGEAFRIEVIRISISDPSELPKETVDDDNSITHSVVQRKPFRALLVVARDLLGQGQGQEDADAFTALDVLFDVQKHLRQSKSGANLEVEVVRPATLKSLSSHLEEKRLLHGDRYFDLIHFDLHGMVRRNQGTSTAYLNFAHPSQIGALQPVAATEVGKLVSKYQFHAVILNACQSARADKGHQANLAETLLAAGVQNVVAMAFNFLIGSTRSFLTSFYTCLLAHSLNVPDATAVGRVALREHPSRPARFGLRVDMLDWCVPVCYTSKPSTGYHRAVSNLLPPNVTNASNPRLIGRGMQSLAFERHLVQDRVMYLHGPPLIGKTAFIEELCRDWEKTNFADICLRIDLGHPHADIAKVMGDKIASIAAKGTGSESQDLVQKCVSVLRDQKIVLVLDSLDMPYSLGIEAWREEQDGQKFLDERKSFHYLISRLIEEVRSKESQSFVIIIGRADISWLNWKLPDLDATSYELADLQMPSAITLAETLLPPKLTAGLPGNFQETESLAHVINMLQGQPGTMKWVIPKASAYPSVKAFHSGLLDGTVVITKLDIWTITQHPERRIQHRFILTLRNIATMSGGKAFAMALADFWQTGPLNVSDFGKKLETQIQVPWLNDEEYSVWWHASFLYDMDCFTLTEEKAMRDIHPLFTLVIRGLRKKRSAWLDTKRIVRSFLTPLTKVIGLHPDSSAGDRQDSMAENRLFLQDADQRYTTRLMTCHLLSLGMANFKDIHRAEFVNILTAIDMCCDASDALPIDDWPMYFFGNYTAASRLLLTASEQELLAEGYRRLLKRLEEMPEFPVIGPDSISEILMITTHLASFYGLHLSREKYRPEFTNVGLSVIFAFEAQHGAMEHPDLIYKSLTYRYKALDEIFAGNEEDADWWWSEMLKLQNLLDEAYEEPPIIKKIQTDPIYENLDPAVRDRMIAFNRNVNRQTQSWQQLRTPRFWSEMKQGIQSAKLSRRNQAEFSEEFWAEAQSQLDDIHGIYDEQGLGEDMRRFEDVFPRNFDVKTYVNRFSGDRITAGDTLEQALGLNNWNFARDGHRAMYDQALQNGRWGEAAQHLTQAFSLGHRTGKPQAEDIVQTKILTEFLQEHADTFRVYKDNVPIPMFTKFMRELGVAFETAGLSRPGVDRDKIDNFATLLERGAEGLATEEETAEVEEFWSVINADAPAHLQIPAGYFRDLFRDAKARRDQSLSNISRTVIQSQLLSNNEDRIEDVVSDVDPLAAALMDAMLQGFWDGLKLELEESHSQLEHEIMTSPRSQEPP